MVKRLESLTLLFVGLCAKRFKAGRRDPGGRLNQVGHTEKYKYEIRAYEIGLNLFQVSVYTSQIHVNVKHCNLPTPVSAHASNHSLSLSSAATPDVLLEAP